MSVSIAEKEDGRLQAGQFNSREAFEQHSLDISLADVNFNARGELQKIVAEERRRSAPRNLRPTLRQRLVQLLEGPWAPGEEDLPERRYAHGGIGSAKPFWRTPASVESAAHRDAAITSIEKSAQRVRISKWTSVYEYAVPLPCDHKSLSGLSVLHLSDVHLLEHSSQPTSELGELVSYLERTERRFDMVVFSGDLITVSPADMSDHALDHLKAIASRAHHCFFTHGNHDYHGHTPAVISAWLARAGFHDINNRMAELRRGEKHLNIYGLDDSYFGQPVAPSQIPSDRYCIVMTHNLDAVSSEFPDFTGVVLSGHTHWGELRLFDGAKIMNRWGYCDDLNQHTRGWKALSDNALSFVHPGLARYYVPYKFFRHPPGFVIHTFY
jgi:hypothetical protein